MTILKKSNECPKRGAIFVNWLLHGNAKEKVSEKKRLKTEVVFLQGSHCTAGYTSKFVLKGSHVKKQHRPYQNKWEKKKKEAVFQSVYYLDYWKSTFESHIDVAMSAAI